MRYESRQIDMTPKDILRLASGARLGSVETMEQAYQALSADRHNQREPESFMWAWTAVTAYRAGRLSMWRDCRRHQAAQKAGDALGRILRRNDKAFARHVLTYAAKLEKTIAGGGRRGDM